MSLNYLCIHSLRDNKKGRDIFLAIKVKKEDIFVVQRKVKKDERPFLVAK